jgi:hypothetical protein
MNKMFVPAKTPMKFPLGPDGRAATQIELYDKLSDKNCDLRDIAAVVEPIIVAAQIQPVELCDVISTNLGS